MFFDFVPVLVGLVEYSTGWMRVGQSHRPVAVLMPQLGALVQRIPAANAFVEGMWPHDC